MSKLTDVSTHYEFGANWKEFGSRLSDAAVDEAVKSFARLLEPAEIAGQHVLDIGCGSGLSALAALRLGAASVTALDIDQESVETARDLLQNLAPDGPWTVELRSVFDGADMPHFDIVHSWGVLHHTGDMRRAIRMAVDRVAPGGLFCVALYRKTPLCWAWRLEKRLYTNAPPWSRRLLETVYMTAFGLGITAKGRSFRAYVDGYASRRGMDWKTDVRDWLGGYPYESISKPEVMRLLNGLGFSPVRVFCRKPGIGVFGSGCDEYVFRRDN